MQVHEIRVALVDDPLVRGRLIQAARCAVVVALRAIEHLACHCALQTMTSACSVLMAFMVRELDLELDVVSNVGVLPHQELYCERVLC